MKTFLTLLLAFVLSLLAGGMTVQIVAEAVRGDEAFIIAHAVMPVFVTLSMLVLAIVYSVTHRPGALGLAASLMAGLLVLAATGAILFDFVATGSRVWARSVPLFGSVAVGGCLATAIQYWFLRRRALQRVGETGGITA
jgi:hypothetical protein